MIFELQSSSVLFASDLVLCVARLADAKWTAEYESLSPLAAWRNLRYSGRLESSRQRSCAASRVKVPQKLYLEKSSLY